MDIFTHFNGESLTIMEESENIDLSRKIQNIRDCSASFCENCDKFAEMSDQNVHKRRKTRRGRRKPYKVNNLADDESGDLYTSNIQKQLLNQTTRCRAKGKTLLRTPVSPKAPMNSNQFLIEDRGDYIVYDDTAYLGLPSPDQMLSNRSNTPDFDGSFYDDTSDNKRVLQDCQSAGDDEYIPLEETTDFMGREFEREFAQSQYTHEMDTRLSLKNKLFKESSKQDIIENLIKLEIRLKEKKSKEISFRSNETTLVVNKKSYLLSEIEYLQKENSSLKEENEHLKSLIS